jgi:PAS domain S-box-containing protein
LYNAELEQEMAFSKLSYSYADYTTGDLKAIISLVKNDDSLFAASEKYISANDEHELFERLKKVHVTKSQYLDRFFQQIDDRNYDRIKSAYKNYLDSNYRELLQLHSQLLSAVNNNDQKLMKKIGLKIIRINNINIWISIGLIILVISLGFSFLNIVKKDRRTTSALKESEKRYRTITEQTNEIIERCDADGKFVFVNDSFKKTFEYSDDELSDLTLSDLLAEGSLPQHENTATTKILTNVQRVFKSKSGKIIYLQGTIVLEYSNGIFEGSIGFFNDVTEKKRLQESLVASELKFRKFFDLAPIPMWVIDPETFNFVLVNKASLAHYGYTEKEFLQMTYLDIRGKQDAPAKEFLWLREEGSGSINNKNSKSSFTHVTNSGEIIKVEIYTSPISLNDRQCILCVAIDVTERNEFENKITKAIIKTQEDERYEIGSELHDNVCQILAAAKMSLGMVRPSILPNAIDAFKQGYEAIDLATNEIRNLSHRLAPAFFDNTNLEEAFKNLLRSFNIAQAYDVSVYFDKSAREISITRDIKLNLYRILQEQLRNIIEHANCSRIELRVFIYEGYFLMRIADNGVGFNKNEVQYGIGMANMKRRSELFGGKLYIKSLSGHGCEVVVKIPMDKLN